MRNRMMVRMTDMVLRALLLIIVGAYIFLKSGTAADTATGKTPAVLKNLERDESPLRRDSISTAGMLLLARIKAGANGLVHQSSSPEIFYVRKLRQPAIYN
ncbi:hypothetical protein [Chitinophaga ginsengisoli]|uniref:Uncharacterized protein n=1 Tax=Chitinophaga ginsengisoli TaxID=363837 RepID=A0A2P8GHB0_9BACT|nr:hypothetical protein [Chitinophaga ginsengisoli]PSL33352.1 hypothetical protein CLV42_103335 [Chitinophaga ginsengisoli]